MPRIVPSRKLAQAVTLREQCCIQFAKSASLAVYYRDHTRTPNGFVSGLARKHAKNARHLTALYAYMIRRNYGNEPMGMPKGY